MYIKALAASAAVTFAAPLHAQQLDAALRTALTSDPQIAGADALVYEAEASVDMAKAARLPSLNLDVHAGFQTADPSRRTPGTWAAGVAARFELPIFTGGQLTWQIRSARAALDAQIADRDGVVNMRLATTASRYSGLYRDHVIEAALLGQVTNVATILDRTREQARQHDLTDVDVKQTVARLAVSQAQLAQARALLTRSEEELREITGEYVTQLTDPGMPALPTSLLDDLPRDISSSPAVKAATARVAMAEADVRIARSARAFQLFLTSDFQNANDLSFTGIASTPRFLSTMQVGFNLRVPLFQGGRAGARIRQAQHILVARIEDRRSVENRMVADIRSQYARLKSADGAIAAITVALEASKAALDGVKVGALIGDRTNLDILNAVQDVSQIEIQLARIRQQRLELAYSILGLMGRLPSSVTDTARKPGETAVRTAAVALPRRSSGATAKLHFDQSGLWVWKGSATWSLKPNSSVTGIA